MRDDLTPREEEVYRYLLKGLDYYSIGELMGIGKPTLVTHIMHIFEKKLVSNRYELLALRIKELENEIKELTHNDITSANY